jgi:hypothetical protein
MYREAEDKLAEQSRGRTGKWPHIMSPGMHDLAEMEHLGDRLYCICEPLEVRHGSIGASNDRVQNSRVGHIRC